MGYRFEMEALILGALRDGPQHGYRIAQGIRAKSAETLKVGDNQIYPILHRLEADGLVASEWEQQLGKPARKVYALTVQVSARLEEHRRAWQSYAAHFLAVVGAPEASHA